MISLVTDRTPADVEARNEKGVYRAEDLNRVESAVEEIAAGLQGLEARLKAYAQAAGVLWSPDFEVDFEPQELNLTVKTDWQMNDLWPGKPQMRRYLQNVAALCGILQVDSQALPGSMELLTWEGANEIEGLLLQCAEAAAALEAEKKALIDSRRPRYLIYVPVGSSSYQGPDNETYCCMETRYGKEN